MQANGLPFASPRSSVRSTPVGEHAAGARNVLRDPELAREVVAAARRQDAERRASAHARRERPDQPVAAQRDDDLAAGGRLAAACDACAMSRVSTTR